MIIPLIIRKLLHPLLGYDTHVLLHTPRKCNISAETLVHHGEVYIKCLVFLWVSGRAVQKVVGSIPREHTYWQNMYSLSFG